MPSVKPKIVIRTTEEIKNKFDEIAKKENRSASNLAETIITEYIKQYELLKKVSMNKENTHIIGLKPKRPLATRTKKSVNISNNSVNNGNITM